MPNKKFVFVSLLLLVVVAGAVFFFLRQRSAPPKFSAEWPPAIVQDHYLSQIQPLFNARCVACHSCYNSPCQMDLTSYDGVRRGASHVNVYDFPLLEARSPTRLGVDAKTTSEWRSKGFFTTLNPDQPGPSILVELMRPRDRANQLHFSAESSRMCIDTAAPDNIKKYFKENPGGGMPFGFPPVADEEFARVQRWVAEGAMGPSDEAEMIWAEPFRKEGREVLARWEKDFNRDDLKSRLVYRYIYEHLFAAHLHFSEMPGEFYRVMRASNREGPPQELPTTRPIDDPGRPFFYRFQKITNAVVMKTHLPYAMTEARRHRWQELFFKPGGQDVKAFPPYGAPGANAFRTFAALSAEARYRFLLDDAYYHVATFIKGPVCRGQTALNVINDQFWVTFVDPKFDRVIQEPELQRKLAANMNPPASTDDEIKLFKNYRDGYQRALRAKYAAYRKSGKPFGFEGIWDGDGRNPSALLTVYRHFDSAQVIAGAWGEVPSTVWVMDYQIFEDIYYNLVAGYNVFGPIIHQLNTRLYMDISRISSEDMFLNFLPTKVRAPLRSSWYREVPESRESFAKEIVDLFQGNVKDLATKKYPYYGTALKSDVAVEDRHDDAKAEFLKMLFEKRFSKRVRGEPDRINRDAQKGTRFADISGHHEPFSSFLPDVVLMRVKNGETAEAYTWVHNKAHLNVSMLLFENERRQPSEDTLNVLPGHSASYPNLYVDVNEQQLPAMLEDLKAVREAGAWENWVRKWGKNRLAPDFWELHDWFNNEAQRTNPVDGGLIDLNRYVHAW